MYARGLLLNNTISAVEYNIAKLNSEKSQDLVLYRTRYTGLIVSRPMSVIEMVTVIAYLQYTAQSSTGLVYIYYSTFLDVNPY